MNDVLARLPLAMADWAEVVGREFVVCDEGVLAQWETATFATAQKVFSIVCPASADEVAECLAIASKHQVPLYPISRGRNWGLGSRVPVQDAAVLDLGRMDAVLSVDERFGCITLQPGVTFQKVHDYLKERGSRWFLPVIGGPTDASVIGNCLERGDVTGPQKDRLASIISLQVALADGTIISTGYGRFGETPLAGLSATPAGPSVHGLFTQSNFGVVTRATIALAPLPQSLQIAHAEIAQESFAACVDALQSLAIQLGEHAVFSLWNGSKFNARQRNIEKHFAPDMWFCNCGLYAPSAHIAEAQRELAVDALTTTASALHVLDETNTPDLREIAGIFLGKPNNDNVASLYARKEVFPKGELDPDRDRCGTLWLCPEVPFDGASAITAVNLCAVTCRRFDYEPVIGIFPNTARTLRFFISIFYDRDAAGEDEKAMQCCEEMQMAFAQCGFLPFRLGLHSMHMAHGEDGLWEILQRMKSVVDPVHIVAPGRYLREQ